MVGLDLTAQLTCPHSFRIPRRSDPSHRVISVRCLAVSRTRRLGDSSDFRSTYKATLAADAVLSRLASSRCKPRLSAHRTVVRRSLAAFSLGQPGLSRLALRQAIELTFWTIYFSEHSVEWVSFEGNPSLSRGEPTSPIRHAAHREPAFYRAYARELFESESSRHYLRLGGSAVSRLWSPVGGDSPNKHRYKPRLGPAIEDQSARQLAAFRKIHREVCASICIALAALTTSRFKRVPAGSSGLVRLADRAAKGQRDPVGAFRPLEVWRFHNGPLAGRPTRRSPERLKARRCDGRRFPAGS